MAVGYSRMSEVVIIRVFLICSTEDKAIQLEEDDLMSVASFRSLASSSSLASEVLDRARNRRNNFWNWTDLTAEEMCVEKVSKIFYLIDCTMPAFQLEMNVVH